MCVCNTDLIKPTKCGHYVCIPCQIKIYDDKCLMCCRCMSNGNDYVNDKNEGFRIVASGELTIHISDELAPDLVYEFRNGYVLISRRNVEL